MSITVRSSPTGLPGPEFTPATWVAAQRYRASARLTLRAVLAYREDRPQTVRWQVRRGGSAPAELPAKTERRTVRLLEIADIGNSPVWRRLWAADSYRHPAYTPAELRAGSGRRPSLYYLPSGMRPAAAGCPGGEFTPAHLVAADTDGPVMGVVLTVERNGGRTYLSSFGRPIYIVEDLAASAPRRRTAARLIHRRIEELRKEYGTEGYHFRDFLSGGRHWASLNWCFADGGQSLPYFVQMIDLNQPIEVIRSDFRQSVRDGVGVHDASLG